MTAEMLANVMWMVFGLAEGILGSVIVVSYAHSRAQKERHEAESHIRAGYIRQGREMEAARVKLDMEHMKGRIAELEGQNDDLRKEMAFESKFVHRFVTEGRAVARTMKGEE